MPERTGSEVGLTASRQVTALPPTLESEHVRYSDLLNGMDTMLPLGSLFHSNLIVDRGVRPGPSESLVPGSLKHTDFLVLLKDIVEKNAYSMRITMNAGSSRFSCTC